MIAPSVAMGEATARREGKADYSQFGILTLQDMTGSTQDKLRLTVRMGFFH